jgi:hypothetical protein
MAFENDCCFARVMHSTKNAAKKYDNTFQNLTSLADFEYSKSVLLISRTVMSFSLNVIEINEQFRSIAIFTSIYLISFTGLSVVARLISRHCQQLMYVYSEGIGTANN